MNGAYVRQLSKRTIDRKEDRAREGFHNGWVPFGYLPPEYPKAPDGALQRSGLRACQCVLIL